MNISLDDQLKLAIACGYEDARIAIDVGNNVNKNKHSFVVVDKVNVFQHTSPDTLMRLMFELKISVEHRMFGWNVHAIGFDADKLTTPEEISQAIISCALTVIGGE